MRRLRYSPEVSDFCGSSFLALLWLANLYSRAGLSQRFVAREHCCKNIGEIHFVQLLPPCLLNPFDQFLQRLHKQTLSWALPSRCVFTNPYLSCRPAEEDHDHHLLRHPGRGPGVDYWRHAGLLRRPAACRCDDWHRPTDSQQRKENTNDDNKTKTWNTNARQITNQLGRDNNPITDKRIHHGVGWGSKNKDKKNTIKTPSHYSWLKYITYKKRVQINLFITDVHVNVLNIWSNTWVSYL